MTTIRLDAQTIEKLRDAQGRVVLCDETGKPVRTCLLFSPDSLDGEPDLPDEEWERRAREKVTYSTAEVMEILRRLRRP
jgi:hypothetical protein